MYVVAVTVHVLPEHLSAFLEATRHNHEGTRREAGNRRFDVLQGETDETQFFLYEVYESAAAFQAHQQTPHYLTWRETVAPMMASPRQAARYQSRFPADTGF